MAMTRVRGIGFTLARHTIAAAMVLAPCAALAQSAPPPPPPPEPATTVPAAPPPAEVPPPPAATSTSPVADPVALSESAASPDVFYGMAGRGRWVTVPSWFLGLFTKENVPLSTWGAGFEVFRRKGDMDIVLGFSYQSMGPKDGNWLGKGKSASVDTDFVSFRNFAMIGVDASFIWHQAFNDFIGLRYGAGLGLGVITGDMLRISAGPFCTEDNAGDLSKCYPARGGDPAQPIRGEQALKDTENSPDGGPSNPHRFKEDSVPGAIPILNLTIGLDIRIPNVKGLEIRPLEFGFYNSFFVGGGIGYVF